MHTAAWKPCIAALRCQVLPYTGQNSKPKQQAKTADVRHSMHRRHRIRQYTAVAADIKTPYTPNLIVVEALLAVNIPQYHSQITDHRIVETRPVE